MNRTAFLSTWARSKVLYEHSWLNKLEEAGPSNSAVAMRMGKKLTCSVTPKPAEGRLKIGVEKNREYNHQSEECFPPRSNKLPPNTE